MTAIWPAELPSTPQIQGTTKSLGDGRQISKVTTGVGKRRAFWQGVRPIQCSFNMSTDQWKRFERFWEEDTLGGVAPFWIANAVENNAILTDESGSPLLTADGGIPVLDAAYDLAQFGSGAPQINESYTTSYHRITFTIEVLP